MKHSIRWFLACAAIALFQWELWHGLAKEDGDPPPGLGMYAYSLAIVCLIAWWILPRQRPCGFDKGPMARERIGLKDDGGRLGRALDWLDEHLKP